jgi:hypothetical protein
MSALSRMQQIALAGTIGATVAAIAIAGATGSNATPAASSHSHGGPHWLRASTTHSKLVPGGDSSTGAGSASSAVSTTASSDPASQPSSSATSGATDPAEYDGPEEVDISAAPGPCTQDDVATSRWSTRVTINNPKDAGPLDYLALAISYYDDNEDSEDINDFPHSDPVHLEAGETGSVVLTGPSDYFPDEIVVGGGISPDGQTAKTVGGIDVLDEQDFLKVAKVCGNTTPTPEPYDEETSADGYEGDGSGAETKTVTATVTVTKTVQVEPPRAGEPPTPSPVTTHLAVTG